MKLFCPKTEKHTGEILPVEKQLKLVFIIN